jgi:hypothetical protein
VAPNGCQLGIAAADRAATRSSGEQTGRFDASPAPEFRAKFGKFRTSSPEAFCQRYGRSCAGAIAQKALNSTPFGRQTSARRRFQETQPKLPALLRRSGRSRERVRSCLVPTTSADDRLLGSPQAQLPRTIATPIRVAQSSSSSAMIDAPGIAVAVKRPKPRLTVFSRRRAG